MDETILNTYEEHAIISYEFNGVDKTVDATDTFATLGVSLNNLDLASDELDTHSNTEEIDQYINRKIFLQSLLINKLSETAYGDLDFITFCQKVFQRAYTDKTNLTIRELRDIVANYLTEISIVSETWFDNQPIKYTEFQEDVVQRIKSEDLYIELYFSLLYTGLLRFETLAEKYQTETKSSIVNRFGDDDTSDTTIDFSNSNNISFLVRNNPEVYDDPVSFEGQSLKKVEEMYTNHILPYHITNDFKNTLSEFMRVVSKDELNTTQILQQCGKYIDMNDEIITIDSDEVPDIELTPHMRRFLNDTPLIYQKVLMFVTDTIHNNE